MIYLDTRFMMIHVFGAVNFTNFQSLGIWFQLVSEIKKHGPHDYADRMCKP